MYTFVCAHWFAVTAVAAYLFTAVVGTMPVPGDPKPLGEKLYVWLFDFLHLISNKVAERRNVTFPPAPTLPHST